MWWGYQLRLQYYATEHNIEISCNKIHKIENSSWIMWLASQHCSVLGNGNVLTLENVVHFSVPFKENYSLNSLEDVDFLKKKCSLRIQIILNSYV